MFLHEWDGRRGKRVRVVLTFGVFWVLSEVDELE